MKNLKYHAANLITCPNIPSNFITENFTSRICPGCQFRAKIMAGQWTMSGLIGALTSQNVHLAGHVNRTCWLVTFLVILSKL